MSTGFPLHFCMSEPQKPAQQVSKARLFNGLPSTAASSAGFQPLDKNRFHMSTSVQVLSKHPATCPKGPGLQSSSAHGLSQNRSKELGWLRTTNISSVSVSVVIFLKASPLLPHPKSSPNGPRISTGSSERHLPRWSPGGSSARHECEPKGKFVVGRHPRQDTWCGDVRSEANKLKSVQGSTISKG